MIKCGIEYGHLLPPKKMTNQKFNKTFLTYQYFKHKLKKLNML